MPNKSKIVMFAILVIATLLLLDASGNGNYYNQLSSNKSKSIGSKTHPSCIGNFRDLPIYKLRVEEQTDDGVIISQGTAFLIYKDTWVTATHVVPSDVSKNTIKTKDGIIKLDVDFRISGQDLTVLSGNSSDLIPIKPYSGDYDDTLFEQSYWNVGFPSFTGGEALLTSGTLIGVTNKTYHYDMLVIQGMSGGPTLLCVADEINSIGSISSFANKIIDHRIFIDSDGVEMEELITVNSGKSFSTPLKFLRFLD